VRDRLLQAALQEFSNNGFEAASTRAIATRARTHQPQINYHFGSKVELWKAVVDQLFSELDAYLRDLPPGEPDAVLRELCRRFVRFAGLRPELNRLIVLESTVASDRLDWLVDTHIRLKFQTITRLCEQLDPARVPTTDPVLFYYSFVGAASLLAVNAAEARRLVGGDPLADRVEAHAEAVATMMLGPLPARATEQPG
jgi:AcrR family transcriptional regulator